MTSQRSTEIVQRLTVVTVRAEFIVIFHNQNTLRRRQIIGFIVHAVNNMYNVVNYRIISVCWLS